MNNYFSNTSLTFLASPSTVKGFWRQFNPSASTPSEPARQRSHCLLIFYHKNGLNAPENLLLLFLFFPLHHLINPGKMDLNGCDRLCQD